MLSEANREIRAEVESSVERRRQRAVQSVAFDYLDELIAELEELHLRDHQLVPAAFDEQLRKLEILLPPGVRRPRPWPARIRRMLDTCFDLQAQLQRHRVPRRTDMTARDSENVM